MAITFSNEVAFYGVVKLDSLAILATGGSIGVSTDPIFSSGVWGAGWYTAAEQVSYALNYMRIEGDVSFELAAGNIFTKIKDFAFENRAMPAGTTLDILPQGKAGYSGPAWCSGCSFDASEGSIVTGGFNYSSGNMGASYWKTIDPNDPLDPNRQPGGAASKTTANVPPGFKDVYPYWATKVLLGLTSPPSDKLPDVISWSANYSSSIEFVKFCQGITAEADVAEADYIMVGPMTADGSFTVFTVSNQLDPATFQSQKACRIQMAPGSALSTYNYIDFANIVYNSGGTNVQTGGAYIQADVSFTALGDGTAPPMKLT